MTHNMTNEEILKKAIEKARGNRFGNNFNDYIKQGNYKIVKEPSSQVFSGRTYVDAGYEYSIKDIIFRHDFAKAFWGSKKYRTVTIKKSVTNKRTISEYVVKRKLKQEEWKTQLQKMVLEKEPLNYLKNFL